VLLTHRTPLGTGWTEVWTLNAPATRNALTDEMVAALRAACERARTDAALRVIVLRGAGGHFCAGGSLGGFASAIGQPHGEGVDPLIAVNRDFGRLLQALCDLPQVLIAAVQGAAMGGGVGLVCCADHVIASPDAQFATPEVTLGIVPAQIAPFVVRRLGDATARAWLLSGARWNAHQALAAGLVNAIADGAVNVSDATSAAHGLAPSPLWEEGRGEGSAATVEARAAPTPTLPQRGREPMRPHPHPLLPAAEGAKPARTLDAADDALHAAVLQKLKQLSHAAPAAVAQTKQILAELATHQALDAVLDDAAQRFAQALRGPEAAQGLKAFAARQPAPWARPTKDNGT